MLHDNRLQIELKTELLDLSDEDFDEFAGQFTTQSLALLFPPEAKARYMLHSLYRFRDRKAQKEAVRG